MARDAKPQSPGPGGRDARKGADDPISLGLRRLWADVEKEAVPEDFLDLLDQIDERRADGSASPAATAVTDKSGGRGGRNI